MTAETASGFTQDATDFLSALAANNDRDWFKANKQVYEHVLKQPAEVFCTGVAAKLEGLTGRPHGAKIFRIHRDVRFSKDKTPYNTHLRISFAPEGKPPTAPAWFFSLETDHVVLGAGVFGYAGDALDVWRVRVAGDDGNVLAKQLARLEKDGVRLSEADLKRVPKPYAADHPRADLLKRKGLAVWIDHPDAKIAYGDKASAACLTDFKRLKPVYDWLMDVA